MEETLKLTPHERVTIKIERPDVLEVEAVYDPHASAPPKHLHPDQAEHFRVLEGNLRIRIDGEERELGVGEELDIPAGTVHQMWNPGDTPARVSWQTLPALRTASWFRELGALQASGRVGSQGMPGPLAFGVLLTEYRDVFRIAGPDPLLRPALGALAAVGRARGYRVSAGAP